MGGSPSTGFMLLEALCLLIFSIAWQTGVEIVNEAVSLLPNIILGFLIFLLFLLIGSVAKSLTRSYVRRRRAHQAMAILFGRLVHTTIVVIGFLIAFSDCAFIPRG
jgi:hypothetical protein